VLGLNATSKPGEADRVAQARRHKEILKRCLKNMAKGLLVKTFGKLAAYRRPKSFCLLTLKPIDNDDHFYEESIQRLIEARPQNKVREEWMDELCYNALDPDWLHGKKQEEEERLQKGRENVMTGLTALRLGIKERKVPKKLMETQQDEGWAVDAVRTGNFRDTSRDTLQTGQGGNLIQGIVHADTSLSSKETSVKRDP
jgi:hypothetical protein